LTTNNQNYKSILPLKPHKTPNQHLLKPITANASQKHPN